MRKFLFILALFGGLFFSLPVLAVEKIDRFDATIQIREDAAIEVSEKIEYDFGTAQKHGIFRDIPIKYKARGGNYNLRIFDISVTDEKGAAYKFITSYHGNDIQIKIGDPNVEITGIHTYVINYKIKRAINYFSDHDELYWNVTGDKWPVAIGSTSAKIILPQKIESRNIQTDCFAGLFGSTQKCNSILKGLEQTDSVSFSENQLSAGEGLTIVVGFPKGVVDELIIPKITSKTTNSVYSLLFFIFSQDKETKLRDALGWSPFNLMLFVPAVTFLALFYLWYTTGRDPAGRKIIIAQYDPPDNLTPAEVGTIADEEVHDKDISAEIINLAIKGYLKIIQTEKQNFFSKSREYAFMKLKESDEFLSAHQMTIMDGFFRKSEGVDASLTVGFLTVPLSKSLRKGEKRDKVSLADLSGNFHNDTRMAKEQIYHSLTQNGYFRQNPNNTRGLFVLGAAVLIIIGVILGVFLGFGFIFGMSLVVSGFIMIIFGYLMPARTRKGVLAKEYILGLKLYMSVAEARRLEFHNAPEKKPEVFEKLLPYAMALGVENLWAQQFEGIYSQPPSWYEGSTGVQFSAIALASSLGSFSQTASSSLFASPSSAAGGGSGFSGGGSGGGFGGGGGGSW